MSTSESETADKRRGIFTTSSALVLISALGISAGVAISTADRSVFGSMEYSRQTATLILAEAAVEDAMANLDALDKWDELVLPRTNFSYPHRVGPGTVWSDISNDAWDQGGSKDTNSMVLIKGYARHLNSDIVKGIEVLYWRPVFTIPPVAGVVLCGEDIFSADKGNVAIDGFNHSLPDVGCTGSHCDAVRNYESPDVAGLAFEVAGQEAYAGYPKTLLGVPPVSTDNCSLKGASGVCARMRTLMRNSHRFPGLESLTSWPAGNKTSYGSVSDPKYLRVAKGTTLKLNGNTQGAGVMFVDGTLEINGTFTWTGAILIGPGAKLDQRGTANIFGSIITGGQPTNKASVIMGGSGSVAWAADAVLIGPINLPGLLSSWREFQVSIYDMQ